MLNGIDVSKHNEKIDWQTVKNSGQVDYAILRAGYGKLASQKDVQFERNYAECKKYGIPVGCYWYSYAKSVEEIKTEAKVFLSVISGKQFEYPVYLDFEEKSQFNLGKAKCIEMAIAFMEILQNAGYYVGMYCSSSYLNSYFRDAVNGRYTVWCAHYGVAKPSYTGAYDMWQYSAKGKVKGVSGGSGYVDVNYCYKEDFPETIKGLGLNGFKKEGNVAELKPVEEVVKEVLAGQWGNGADRKARLTAAGYNYSEVQKAVNEAVKVKEVEITKEKKTIEITIDGKTYQGILEEK